MLQPYDVAGRVELDVDYMPEPEVRVNRRVRVVHPDVVVARDVLYRVSRRRDILPTPAGFGSCYIWKSSFAKGVRRGISLPRPRCSGAGLAQQPGAFLCPREWPTLPTSPHLALALAPSMALMQAEAMVGLVLVVALLLPQAPP